MEHFDVRIHILTVLVFIITFFSGLLMELPIMSTENAQLFGVLVFTVLLYVYTLYKLYTA